MYLFLVLGVSCKQVSPLGPELSSNCDLMPMMGSDNRWFHLFGMFVSGFTLGGTPPQPNLSMFLYASWSKLSETLRNGIKISVGQAVLEFLIKTKDHVFINNSRTTWLTEISMPLSFSDNLLQVPVFFFHTVLVILRCRTKHVQFWFEVQFLLKRIEGLLMRFSLLVGELVLYYTLRTGFCSFKDTFPSCL